MRSITRYDCIRGCEITLVLNDHDEVIGVQVFFEEPVDLYNFKIENILSPKSMLSPRTQPRIMRPAPAPPEAHQMTSPRPPIPPSRPVIRSGGCGGNK